MAQPAKRLFQHSSTEAVQSKSPHPLKEEGFWKIDQASSYFDKGQPPHYFRRCCVSRSEFEMESVWVHSAI
ncbi:hypothetical protein, partial [Pseudanabaena sp. FACHB-2040]|uniref:hypothetical protein n=1 Tax=Pseudanabaena sp. FACHB-2040 TaxID=2692859 RepID=UPI001A7EA8DE